MCVLSFFAGANIHFYSKFVRMGLSISILVLSLLNSMADSH